MKPLEIVQVRPGQGTIGQRRPYDCDANAPPIRSPKTPNAPSSAMVGAVFGTEGRRGNALRLKFAESGIQTLEILGVRQDQQVGIAAKLRCAVEHAGLAPHQQGTDLVRSHRRKDFPYPARDQANLRCAGNGPKARRWRASVPVG